MSRASHNHPSSPPAADSPQTDSNPLEVSAASLRQLLEMYRLSGLRWYLMPEGTKIIPTVKTPTKPEPLITSEPLTKPARPAKSEPPTESASPTATTPSQPSKPKETKPPAPAPLYSTWQLPVLTLDQRQQNFAELRKRVAACIKCNELANYRTQTVFGDGTLQPQVCFFGEAPGADEDKQGIPFVGKAGQLLDKIIEATTLKRPDDVYILNSLRCRPPSNRTPTPEEVENCRPFFELQLEVLQPKYIVCLGAVAVRAILQRNESVGMLRGKFHAYRGAKVLVTYHPAYLLRNPDAKKLVWEDMQLLMAEMGLRRKGG